MPSGLNRALLPQLSVRRHRKLPKWHGGLCCWLHRTLPAMQRSGNVWPGQSGKWTPSERLRWTGERVRGGHSHAACVWLLFADITVSALPYSRQQILSKCSYAHVRDDMENILRGQGPEGPRISRPHVHMAMCAMVWDPGLIALRLMLGVCVRVRHYAERIGYRIAVSVS